jgi:hypothetical protein
MMSGAPVFYVLGVVRLRLIRDDDRSADRGTGDVLEEKLAPP